MLTELQLRNFRCFEALRLEFAPGFNFFVGANGQGKTSILEGICVLLRLQSQRSSSLGPLIKIGEKSYQSSGVWDGHSLRFRYSRLRRKIEFDEVEQRTAGEYLQLARVVSIANTDIDLVRGGSDGRRRYLDFLGTQIEPRYRPALRAYERALRSRNALLKSARARPREIAAYDEPLLSHGLTLMTMRADLVAKLGPIAAEAHRKISGGGEVLELRFEPGSAENFAEALAGSRERELRLRQTVVGPHRDEIDLSVQGMKATQYASEGQQRTVALALKLAQAALFAAEPGNTPPVLLIDDIFGELDRERRNLLLEALPSGAQRFVTSTNLDWREGLLDGPITRIREMSS